MLIGYRGRQKVRQRIKAGTNRERKVANTRTLLDSTRDSSLARREGGDRLFRLSGTPSSASWAQSGFSADFLSSLCQAFCVPLSPLLWGRGM